MNAPARTDAPRADVAQGGASSALHWAHIGESTCAGGLWLLYHLHRLLGRRAFRLCLAPVIVYYWATRPIARRASREYLRRVEQALGALGEAPGRRHELRHLTAFAESILDKLLAWSGRYRFERVKVSGGDALRAMIERGEGGLFVTAHVGCPELCQAMAERVPGLRLTALVHTRHAERFDRLLRRLAPDARLQLLQVTDIDAGTAALLAQRVARGEFVAIAGDRVPVTASKTAVVPFLGRDAQLPVGPYVLAALLKCPLYLLSCLRDGDGYALRIEPLAPQVVLPRAQRAAALQRQAAAFAARLEALLARAPYQWFNFHAFWDQPGRALSADAVAPDERRR